MYFTIEWFLEKSRLLNLKQREEAQEGWKPIGYFENGMFIHPILFSNAQIAQAYMKGMRHAKPKKAVFPYRIAIHNGKDQTITDEKEIESAPPADLCGGCHSGY